MKVTFYGTRGSIPVCDPRLNAEFGGNTSCILLTFDNGRIGILDAGTGIRKLGNDLLASSVEQHDNIFIGFSHTHWDHIQGFPFFKPAYDPRQNLTLAIYGKGREERSLEQAFHSQMQSSYFPVPLSKLGASITFMETEARTFTTPSGIHITAELHAHPGGAFGYRITEGDRTLVYCTDVEHGERIDPRVVALAEGADLLIHDAQYTPEELEEKKGWGHSSWLQAVEVAEQAGVRRLACFHHDPEHDDEFLRDIERQVRRRLPDAFLARDGGEIVL